MSDRDSFNKFVREHDVVELFEARLHQGNFKEFMAEHAVHNIIDNKGLKPTGKITYKCKPSGVVFECSARQQGC